ncbi:hypothetical protein BJX64DRAFT_259989 [Aspergillus heterothallicus]
MSFTSKSSRPLLVVFSTAPSEGTLDTRCTGVELLSGIRYTGKEGKIASGQPSIGAAILEVALPVAYLSLCGYALYTAFEQVPNLIPSIFHSPPSTNTANAKDLDQPIPAPPKPTEKNNKSMKQTAQDMKDYVSVTLDMASFLKKASTVPWNQDRLKSIAEGKRQLQVDCAEVERHLGTMSLEMKALFPSQNEQG